MSKRHKRGDAAAAVDSNADVTWFPKCHSCGQELTMFSRHGKQFRKFGNQFAPVLIGLGCPECSLIVDKRMLLVREDSKVI